MNQEKINFHVARDFSELFNVATKFLSQNFKHFFKTLFFIAGPFVLISSIFGAFYQSHALRNIQAAAGGGQFNVYSTLMNQFGWEYVAFIFCSFCSGMVMLTTIYSYIIAYNLHGPNNFDIALVKELVFKNIWKVMKGALTVFLIVIAILILASIIGGILISVLSVFGIVLVVLLVIGLIFILPPYLWQFASFYLPMLTEDLSVSEALRKIRGLMRGDFFSTWLLIVVATLILGILALVFSIPLLIYQTVLQLGGMSTTADNVPYMVIAALSTFCHSFIYSVFYIVCAFHYYSLTEKKDGTALLNRIDEIGNTPSNNVDEQY